MRSLTGLLGIYLFVCVVWRLVLFDGVHCCNIFKFCVFSVKTILVRIFAPVPCRILNFVSFVRSINIFNYIKFDLVSCPLDINQYCIRRKKS